MASANDWNGKIISEFRQNGGSVGGPFEGADLLLLHTTGKKTGKERINPLMYQRSGNEYVVFASKGGHTSDPDWYRNLLANPDVKIELGDKTIAAKARVAQGDEHERLWSEQKRLRPQFAEYEKTANRVIPVVVLEPTAE